MAVYLNISVEVPELLCGGEGLDATPALVGEEIHWANGIGGCGEAQEEVKFIWVNLLLHQ